MNFAPQGKSLNEVLARLGLEPVDEATGARFDSYLSLILRWNAKTNLTAVRTSAEIQEKHFAESIACARALPPEISTLLDLGSGAGLPGIAIALCRPQIAVTLAESQGKKAAFLQEVVRSLGIAVKVHAGRAETLQETFDCVVLRAVDRMESAIAIAARLVRPGGWLAPMTTVGELDSLKKKLGAEMEWYESVPLPGSEQRIVAIARRG